MPTHRLDVLGSQGLVQDVPGYSIPGPAVTSGNNFRTDNEALESTGGWSSLATISSGGTIPCYHMFGTPNSNGDVFWNIFFGTTKYVAWDGTTQTDVSPAAPPSSKKIYQTCLLNGNCIVTNNTEKPYSWDFNTANDFTLLAAFNATNCAVIRSFKNYLFAFDVVKGGIHYPNRFKWSSQANTGGLPSSWDETDPASGAGERDFGDDTIKILDGYPLRDVFIAYAENKIFGIQFIGGTSVWRTYEIYFNHGILCANAVIPFENKHFVVTKGDVIVHDGTSMKSVIDGKNRKFLFDNIDSAYYTNTFVTYHESKDEIWIYFPTSGNEYPNIILVWNYVRDTWSRRNCPANTTFAIGAVEFVGVGLTWDNATMTWEQATQVWNEALYNPALKVTLSCNTDGNVYKYDVGVEENGVARETSIEKIGIKLPDANGSFSNTEVFCVTGIRPALSGNITNFEFGASMSPESGYRWEGPYTYDPSVDYKVDFRISGRYFGIRTYNENQWRFSSVEIVYEQDGMR